MSIGRKAAHVRREARKGQSRDHECHATGCKAQVPPAMFMCRKHWAMVPKAMQDAIWKHYQAGQERGDVQPTDEYFEATKAAVEYVVKIANAQGRLPL